MTPCPNCGALPCDQVDKAPMEAVAWREKVAGLILDGLDDGMGGVAALTRDLECDYVDVSSVDLGKIADAILALIASHPVQSPEAVAWRVKDYADGWILFHHEAPARKSGEARNGALVQALAVIPVQGGEG